MTQDSVLASVLLSGHKEDMTENDRVAGMLERRGTV